MITLRLPRAPIEAWPRPVAPSLSLSRIDLLCGLGAALVTLVVAISINLPMLTTFEVAGDDYAVGRHSSRFFDPSAHEWLFDGWAGYFQDFPEIAADGTNFVRPGVNSSIYLDSWLMASPDSVFQLTTNYLGHAIAVGLVFLLSRRLFGLSRVWALLAAALFAGSLSTDSMFNSAAFRGDMLGGLLALSALLLALVYLDKDRPARLALAVGVVTLAALLTKETAWALPAAIAWLLAWRTPWRRLFSDHVVLLTGLAVSLGLVAGLRLQAGLDGIYVRDALPHAMYGVPMSFLNPLRFAATAFMPVEADFLRSAFVGVQYEPGFIFRAAHMLLAIGVNGVGWLLFAYFALRRDRRVVMLGGLALICSVVPIVLKADPRFMYLGQALLLPLLVSMLVQLRSEPVARHLPRAVFVLAPIILVMAGPLYQVATVAGSQPGYVAENASVADLRSTLAERLSDPDLKRVYLVNAPQGIGLAALEYYAIRAGRDDLDLRLVNYRAGATKDTSATGFSVATEGEGLRVTVDLGGNQRLFSYFDPEMATGLGQPGLIEYEPITDLDETAWGKVTVRQKTFSFVIPRAEAADYLMIGFDPRDNRLVAYEPASQTWQPAR